MNAVNKMAVAKKVFNEVYSVADVVNGRKKFMERVMAEAGLSKAGASTYHQNLRNQAVNGKGLYEYNKNVKKDVVVEEVKAYVPEYRWTVLVNGVVVNSFPTRAKAQAEAKAVGGKWGDMNK